MRACSSQAVDEACERAAIGLAVKRIELGDGERGRARVAEQRRERVEGGLKRHPDVSSCVL